MTFLTYTGEYPYSAEHVTYTGVPTAGVSNLSMRVGVVYALGVSNLRMRVGVVYALNVRNLVSRVTSLRKGASSLQMRVGAEVWRAGRTPSGRVRLRKYKTHTLTPVTGAILIQGCAILNTKGKIAISGLVYKKTEGLIFSEGSRLESVSGGLPGAGIQLNKISGTVNAEGSNSLKKQGGLIGKGTVVSPTLNGSIVLTGTKDLSAVLVALDIGGVFNG